ncbi:hypothetical protein C922_05785 [Plasmodium inui San Antonio 1]|uniref:Uncharacterized protein n=1 Tax=Plasmodium inui San Antonio 1 TaxID=1237626 RepID=W7A417_9APIC|nr:hypothetical protein C922_05785 [Plasmodium inui San Antonio 1]EUD63834.1 hypothetical protein C922_05785 [Plasmodium inui San Antonio 1]
MMQKIKWQSLRSQDPDSGYSSGVDRGSRFWFSLSRQGKTPTRNPAGVGQWMETVLEPTDTYQLQKRGFKQGILTRGTTGEDMTWEDVLNDIIKWCLKDAEDKKNDSSEDGLLGCAERRLWRGLMGDWEVRQCNNHATCQKMLFLIGCIVYKLWEGDERLIKTRYQPWSRCEEVLKRLLEEKGTIGLDKREHWKVQQQDKLACAASNSFKNCKMETLSLIVSVGKAIKSLCPSCPLHGLTEIFGDIMQVGPGQKIRCPKRSQGYEFCVVDEKEESEGLELFRNQTSQKAGVSAQLLKDVHDSPPQQVTSTYIEGKQETTKNQNTEQDAEEVREGEPDAGLGSRGEGKGKIEHPKNQEQESLNTQEPVQTDSVPGGSGEGDEVGGGLSMSTVGLPSEDRKTKNLVVGPEGTNLGTKLLGDSRTEASEKERIETPGTGSQEEQGIGATVGIAVGVGLMLISSAYGLFRIFARRGNTGSIKGRGRGRRGIGYRLSHD